MCILSAGVIMIAISKAKSVYPVKPAQQTQADPGRYFTQSLQCWFSRVTAHLSSQLLTYRLHISTSGPYLSLEMSSGAAYSRVPHGVFIRSSRLYVLLKPKSEINCNCLFYVEIPLLCSLVLYCIVCLKIICTCVYTHLYCTIIHNPVNSFKM